MILISRLGRTRWTVARSKGKTIAEISLSKTGYTVEPLKKLTKTESAGIAAYVAMCLEGGGPGKRVA